MGHKCDRGGSKEMTVKSGQKTLQEHLNEVSRNIQRIRTGDSDSDGVVYKSDGDRISVMINPSKTSDSQD